MDIRGLNVLVTGGAGFIGSHVVDALLPDNRVTVLDDMSVGSPDNLAAHRDNPRLRIVHGDIREKTALAEAMRGMDAVFHLAVKCIRVSLYDPEGCHTVNAGGTMNVCQAALANRVKRLVYVSSSEVYGSAHDEALSEADACKPSSPYGASKLAGEVYVRSFWFTYRLPTVIVRPFNAYGPRAHYEGAYGEVIPKFIVRVMNGLPPVIHGAGTQTRDFTYVTETAQGILLAAANDHELGEPINICSGKEISIIQLAEAITRVLGRPELQAIHDIPRPGDIQRHIGDGRRAEAVLGFAPRIPIDEGLRRYIAWMKEEHQDWKAALAKDVERTWIPPGRMEEPRE
ncbi:MAG: NAD-dependent epimerase/dehydratase family protein [Planctomycetes bacterium]|nr:NAD-dependent epimerase/dehydratase family protein [Planctomycetota bacterium]